MKILVVLLISWLPTVGACSQSPLFNHKNAEDVIFLPPTASGEQKSDVCDNPVAKLGLCLHGHWEVAPTVSNEVAGVLIVGFFDQNREPLQAPLIVEAKMWMPDMGHGSMPTHVKRLANSQGALTHEYRISEMYFLMPGHWQILLKIQNEAGETGEAVVDVNLQ